MQAGDMFVTLVVSPTLAGGAWRRAAVSGASVGVAPARSQPAAAVTRMCSAPAPHPESAARGAFGAASFAYAPPPLLGTQRQF